jgi:MoxR-like ATPase
MTIATAKPIQSSITLRSKLLRLEQELNQIFLEREELIRVILLSLLTRHNTLIFGKHGAAKSSLVRAVSNAISCGFFGIQLGKDTTRDEIFGPIKISELSNDKLCRAYENFLPGKPLVFLDEIDKANSIILNSLYTAMEERQFLDDGVMQPIPLISLFGAANNITQFQSDALAPLLDRFLFRVEVNWIQSDTNFLEYVRRRGEQDSPVLTTVLSLSDVAALHLQVQQVSFPRDAQESVAKLRKDLASEGIFASDRRWGYIIDLLKAVAFLAGDNFVAEEHFQPLRHVLWTDSKQIPTIDRLLKALDQGLPAPLKAMLNQVTVRVDTALQNHDPATLLGEAALLIIDLKALKQDLATAPKNNKIRQAIRMVEQKINQVASHRQNIANV